MQSPSESLPEDSINALLDSVRERYGVDFHDYARASLRRRIVSFLSSEHAQSVPELERRLRIDPELFQRFVHGIAVNVTSMFRDPSFYLTLRKQVIPLLATYPFIRLWVAGCSTGEEVYSTAILFQEEGLYDRVRIYATDIDAVSIERAKHGIFPLASMKDYSANYQKAGGTGSLSNYYTADHENVVFRNALKRNIVFAQHNLASDSSFNEFHVILCRNVMIYFNNVLRERVLALLHDSLIRFGILGLGSKESLQFSNIRTCYEQIVDTEKIYKKVI